MKFLSVMMALLVLAAAADAEDWECARQSGCPARINEDGELQEIDFRKGDKVSTEDGWIVTPDDGWEKLDTSPKKTLGGSVVPPPPPSPPAPLLGGGEVPHGSSWSGGLYSVKVNISVNPTVNTVNVSVTGAGGTSAQATGTPGASSSSASPTCSESGEMRQGGGTFRVKDGKLQRKTKTGVWVNMRKRKDPAGNTTLRP